MRSKLLADVVSFVSARASYSSEEVLLGTAVRPVITTEYKKPTIIR